MSHLTDISATSGAERKCVRTASGDRIFSSHVGLLNRPNMSRAARKVYIFPELDINLMSYVQFLDTGHRVDLTPTTATVTNIVSGAVVETAERTIGSGLFYHPLAPPTDVVPNPAAATPTFGLTLTPSATARLGPILQHPP
jgi:hypothetical protein